MMLLCIVFVLISIWLPLTSSFSALSHSFHRLSFSKPATTRTTSPNHHIFPLSSIKEQKNKSALTDWVVENLSPSSSSSSDASSTEELTKAGENDTLPPDGLLICSNRLHILPSANTVAPLSMSQRNDESIPIHLLSRPNGWGSGVHPTTRLCLEWLCHPDIISGGEVVLDYGCGSGILSLASLGLGASKVVGVDIEAEALLTADANMKMNGYDVNDSEDGLERYELFHTREIEPYCLTLSSTGAVDVCVANILIGQLVRSSMVSALLTNIRPGGWICLSGIRPWEVEALKTAYGTYVDWCDEHYGELDAKNTEGSLESYGFDVGLWARVVGKVKTVGINVEALSEMAVM